MVVIFMGMDWVQPELITLQSAAGIVLVCALADAVVGLVHGWVLARILRAPSSST
jgi:NhaP-type Na+/H+ or K+/H+ antiporter